MLRLKRKVAANGKGAARFELSLALRDDECITNNADGVFGVSLGARIVSGTGRPRRMFSVQSILVALVLVVQDLLCYLPQVEASRMEPKGYVFLGLWHSDRRQLVTV